MLRRLPIESSRPLELFGLVRVVLAVITLIVLFALGLPYDGSAAAVVGGLLIPWSLVIVVLARRRPDLPLHPVVPVIDFAALAVVELVAPDTYAAVRFAALFLIAVHATSRASDAAWRWRWRAWRSSWCRRPSATGDRRPTTTSPSTRRCSAWLRARRLSWSAGCAPPSRPRGCAPAASRGARFRPRAKYAGRSRSRSMTARCRS